MFSYRSSSELIAALAMPPSIRGWCITDSFVTAWVNGQKCEIATGARGCHCLVPGEGTFCSFLEPRCSRCITVSNLCWIIDKLNNGMFAFEGDRWLTMNTTVGFAAHSSYFGSAQSDVSERYIYCHPVCLQCSDAVVWVAGRASGL